MVKPLYPLSDITPDKRKKIKDAQKAKKAYIIQLCKNPYLISIVLVLIVLVSVVVIHSHKASNRLNTSLSPSDKDDSGFSFLKPSKYFSNSKVKDIGAAQKEKLKQMGIDDNADSLGVKVEAKNLREERKILAMRKYEASRQTAERRVKEKEEQREKLKSSKSLRLKEAIMATEDSSMLGLMKLESFLDDALRNTGGESSEADLYIVAYEHLAKVYQKNNREEKAKDAYINAFRLMKHQAPDSQGPEWDNAISNIEQIRARPTR